MHVRPLPLGITRARKALQIIDNLANARQSIPALVENLSDVLLDIVQIQFLFQRCGRIEHAEYVTMVA
ncbi:MAG: hypothetical protein O2880_14550, partial [Proteobacteria bacterium]|nr:hypothetical protein [Pseudomonadota bacterium]